MKNVITRSISGIVYVALIILAIFFGQAAFGVLTLLFTVLGIFEFTKVSHTSDPEEASSTVVLCVDTLGASLICLSPFYGMLGISFFRAAMVIVSYLIVRMILGLYDKGPHAMLNVAKSVFGVAYIGLPMMMLNALYIIDPVQNQRLIFIMFVMIWLNDTGAFCVGSTIGRRRLFERLSPKKSWEGFWGGLICCALAGLLIGYGLWPYIFNIWEWLLFGIVVSVFATWGDLFESMIKRTMHIKDSGNLIPGHGGILDRIDSLLFVAPVTLIYYVIMVF